MARRRFGGRNAIRSVFSILWIALGCLSAFYLFTLFTGQTAAVSRTAATAPSGPAPAAQACGGCRAVGYFQRRRVRASGQYPATLAAACRA